MRAPVLAVGDGALGFWKALREVFPDTKEQRCWWHKIANVLAALPKSAHPSAKAALAEIYNAEDKTRALAAVQTFQAEFGAKFGKAVAKITDDVDTLLAFYDFPAEHWFTCEPRIPSSRPSPPSGSGPASPRAPALAPPGPRWRSSSSSQHKPAGGRSTRLISSRSSAPAPRSSTANLSNDPTRSEVTSKSHDTPIHRS